MARIEHGNERRNAPLRIPSTKSFGRVMDDYKRSELASGSGALVKSRKQAIAIALNEAGASRTKSAANKAALA